MNDLLPLGVQLFIDFLQEKISYDEYWSRSKELFNKQLRKAEKAAITMCRYKAIGVKLHILNYPYQNSIIKSLKSYCKKDFLVKELVKYYKYIAKRLKKENPDFLTFIQKRSTPSNKDILKYVKKEKLTDDSLIITALELLEVIPHEIYLSEIYLLDGEEKRKKMESFWKKVKI